MCTLSKHYVHVAKPQPVYTYVTVSFGLPRDEALILTFNFRYVIVFTFAAERRFFYLLATSARNGAAPLVGINPVYARARV